MFRYGVWSTWLRHLVRADCSGIQADGIPTWYQEGMHSGGYSVGMDTNSVSHSGRHGKKDSGDGGGNGFCQLRL